MFARLLLVLAIDEICPAIENTSPRPPYTKTCPRNLYNCGIVPGRDCYTDYNAVEYTTTGLYDALLNCPDSYLVKISFNDGRGDMDNSLCCYADFTIVHLTITVRADWVKGNSQLICKNGEWRYYSMSWDRPLRHIACYR
ncbi:unnamed protein product [Cylicostephanus goldi]|uniref:Sushi domain-containing protein n=1 Tax=Cylicostephanus goldi TaxID=71465 RepID=A0A3P7N5P5_CYLGO|nr:unnamed protein product [Cylicostephanus goldi]